MNEENKELSLKTLTQQMLSSRMPMQEDMDAALFELGIKPTCGATLVYSMIQKACKGDTSAAKFVKELNGEGGDELEAITGVMTAYSEGMLRRMAGQLPVEKEEKITSKPSTVKRRSSRQASKRPCGFDVKEEERL